MCFFNWPTDVSPYKSFLLPSPFVSIQLLSVDVTHLPNGGGPVNWEMVYLIEQLKHGEIGFKI